MKLSEAIRLGAMLRPQGRYCILGKAGTCALGAALEAAGHLDEWKRLHVLGSDKMNEFWFKREIWSDFRYSMSVHPVNSHVQAPVHDIIVELNDAHLWTRERIADWVATIEPQDEPPTQPTHEVTHEVLDQPAHSADGR